MPEPLKVAGLTGLRAEPEGEARAHPILFLHGVWEGAWFWEEWLDFFARRGWRGRTVNLRGVESKAKASTSPWEAGTPS